MNIKEEADKILQSRKIWGDIWDEYDFITLIDIMRGKTQRTWNLVKQLESIKVYKPETSWKLIKQNLEKINEELIDIYNYATKFKERYLNQTKGVCIDICIAEICEEISKALKKEIKRMFWRERID